MMNAEAKETLNNDDFNMMVDLKTQVHRNFGRSETATFEKKFAEQLK